MLRSGEREGEEGLLTGGGTSCSPPPPTAAAAAAERERARAAHAMLLRRGLSPLRQNPVYLPNNLICPTQPELKTLCCLLLLFLLVFWGVAVAAKYCERAGEAADDAVLKI